MAEEDGLDMGEHSHEVARGTFWGLVGNGALKIVSFVYVIYIARVVSQNDIGLFYLALSLVGLFGAVRSLGLPAALARYVPFYEGRKKWGKVRGLLQSAVALNVATGLLFTALVWLLSGWAGDAFQNPGLPEALRLISAFMLLESLFGIGTNFLQGMADIKGMQLVNNAQNLLKLAITVLFFWLYGASLATMTEAFLASYLGAIALSALMARRHLEKMPQGGASKFASHDLLHDVAPFGLMLSLVQVLWTLVSYADRVLLGYFLPQSNEVLAIYSLAVTLALNVMVFPGTVGGIFLPVISRLVGKNDMDGVRKAMGTAQRWVLFITIPFVAVMVAFSSEMLSTLYGGAYARGGMVMVLFCAGLVFSAFSYVITLALAGMRLVGLEFRVALAVMVSNVALCVLLIPLFGMEGAALAGAGSFAISAALFSHYGHRRIGFSTSPQIYRLMAAGVISCLLLFLARPYVAAAAAMLPQIGDAALRPYIAKAEYMGLLGAVTLLALCIFGALSLFLKCFAAEDVAMVKKAARAIGMPQAVEGIAEAIARHGIDAGNGQ